MNVHKIDEGLIRQGKTNRSVFPQRFSTLSSSATFQFPFFRIAFGNFQQKTPTTGA